MEPGPDAGPGNRGEGWVVAQFALFGAVVLAPRVGPPLPPAIARPLRPLGAILAAAGGALMLRGVADLGASFTPLPRPKDGAALVRDGLYARVRHPIYSGVCLLGLGWAALTANPTRLVLATGLVPFFNAKAGREEAWLLERFPEYARYREEVGKLLPRKRSDERRATSDERGARGW